MDERNQMATGRPTASPPGTAGARAEDSGATFYASSGAPPAQGHTDSPERLAKQGAEEVRREAREIKDQATQAVGDAAGQVKQATQQAADQARQQAAGLVQQLRERSASLVDQQRGRAADLLGDCVAATRRAAQKLHDEQDHNLGDYADTAANKLDAIGNYLRQTDARRLVDDAADAARRRPEWVLGGAFVVGLALSRFLKASREDGAAYGSYRYGASGGHSGAMGGSQTGGMSGGYTDATSGGSQDFGRRPVTPLDAAVPSAVTEGAREFAQATGVGSTGVGTTGGDAAQPLSAQVPPPPTPEMVGDTGATVRVVAVSYPADDLPTLNVGEGRVREQPTVPTTTRVGSSSDDQNLGDAREVH